jgi:hypothetical protein
MKKGTVGFGVCLAVLLFGFVMVTGLFASAADDYKVIKNALKSPEISSTSQKSVQWFNILVMDGDHEKVKITLPVALVEIMLKSCPEKRFNIEHGCDIDIQRIWNDLKAAGPLALVEVEDHGESVKIWLE